MRFIAIAGSTLPQQVSSIQLQEPNCQSYPHYLLSQRQLKRQLVFWDISDEGSLVAVFMSNCRSFSSGYALTFHNWFITYHTEVSTFLFDSHKESMSNHIVVCWHSSRSSM